MVWATTVGGRPGDQVQLVRWARHRAVGSHLGTLDAKRVAKFVPVLHSRAP